VSDNSFVSSSVRLTEDTRSCTNRNGGFARSFGTNGGVVLESRGVSTRTVSAIVASNSGSMLSESPSIVLPRDKCFPPKSIARGEGVLLPLLTRRFVLTGDTCDEKLLLRWRCGTGETPICEEPMDTSPAVRRVDNPERVSICLCCTTTRVHNKKFHRLRELETHPQRLARCLK
jgi:hypothetical protein